MEEREPSYIVSGNVNWYSHYAEQYGGSWKKLKIQIPCDPAVPLLGRYPYKTVIRKDTCIPIFIAALFTVAKTWKWCKYPWTDEWIKKMWYIYMMEYYSAIKSEIGLSLWLSGKESTFQCMRCPFSPWVRKVCWRSKWQPTQKFLPGKSHGQKSLVSYGSWGHKRVGYNLSTNQKYDV